MRRSLWVVTTCALLLVVGIGTPLPNLLPASAQAGLLTRYTLNLGLDFQGGANRLLAVDRAALAKAQAEDLHETVAAALSARGLSPARLGQSL